MKEEFLHFLWKFKLLENQALFTLDGEPITIVSTGRHNQDAGPDFLDAQLQIGDTRWAGHVEIHIKSSDWQAHQHQEDPAYNNVILHVVHDFDKPIEMQSGAQVATLEIVGKYGLHYLDSYHQLMQAKDKIPCHSRFSEVPDLVRNSWIDRLTVHRLEYKTKVLSATWEQTQNDWEESFYILLARNFGFKVNSDGMELLARSLPFSLLNKHRESLFQLEALLLGQAGLLEDATDQYSSDLYAEYLFLQRKHRLFPLQKSVWKFFRLMPVNFPTIRMAQFAALVHQRGRLFSTVLASQSVEQILSFLEIEPSSYWENHYQLGKEAKTLKKPLGKPSRENIIINTIAPMLFLYGQEKGEERLQARAFELLQLCKAEQNTITKSWKSLGAEIKNAAQSQGYIELKNNFCSKKKCLTCSIGVYLTKQREP